MVFSSYFGLKMWNASLTRERRDKTRHTLRSDGRYRTRKGGRGERGTRCFRSPGNARRKSPLETVVLWPNGRGKIFRFVPCAVTVKMVDFARGSFLPWDSLLRSLCVGKKTKRATTLQVNKNRAKWIAEWIRWSNSIFDRRSLRRSKSN